MLRSSPLPDVLTHYYRSFGRPLQSLSALSPDERVAVLDELARQEPLPFRLTHPEYLPERLRIESAMRAQLAAKGVRPEREHPHYFVLGTFSLWEEAGWAKVELPLVSVPPEQLSFTMTDSFFNYRSENLRGIAIPKRPYHGQLFTLPELQQRVDLHGLPGDAWRRDPARIFDVYIEAQLWSDRPLEQLLGA